MNDERLINLAGVEYPNGWRACCYAIEHNGTAVCVSVKRAQELQREGVPYVSGQFVPTDFAHFFAPDFQPIGAQR